MGALGFKVNKLHLFPDPKTQCLYGGLLVISTEITTAALFEAYSFGIFPWPNDEDEILWFCPEKRGVLNFKSYHISKSFLKFKKKSSFTITMNTAFSKVIQHCADVARKDDGTWITQKMIRAYIDFFKLGYAHSVEVWDGEALVGGLYGVFVGGVFSAESMFHLRDNASKLAIDFLIEFLSTKGLAWIDIQMVTPTTSSLGGVEISRNQYLNLMAAAQENNLNIKLGI